MKSCLHWTKTRKLTVYATREDFSYLCVKTLHTHYFLVNSHALTNLRKQAKDLLECAKPSVEIDIEQDEQTAIDWLESVS